MGLFKPLFISTPVLHVFCFSRKPPNVSVLGIAVKNKYNPLKFRRDRPKHFRLYIGYDTCAFCCSPIKFPSLCIAKRQGRIKPTILWPPGCSPVSPPLPPPFNPPGNRCVSPIQPWTTSIHVVRRIYRNVRTLLEIFAPF